MRTSELTLVHAEHRHDPETQKRIAAYAAQRGGRGSSLGPPPTLPPCSSATPKTKMSSGIRESKLARMRVSELTSVHKQHSHDPEMKARISNMREKKRTVEQTMDIASMHSKQHALELQHRAEKSQVRLQKRLRMRTKL